MEAVVERTLKSIGQREEMERGRGPTHCYTGAVAKQNEWNMEILQNKEPPLSSNPVNNQSIIEHLIKSIADGASPVQIERECKNLDLNEIGLDGRTLLMVAAAEGLLPVVETLVRSGASVHAVGRGQMTALHEASANGETSVAKYLLSLGAEVDAQTSDGVTPLMCASAWGNIEVAKLLLENGADRTRTDRSGATAADIAREKCEDHTTDLINSYPK